jgi:hypothetical protein
MKRNSNILAILFFIAISVSLSMTIYSIGKDTVVTVVLFAMTLVFGWMLNLVRPFIFTSSGNGITEYYFAITPSYCIIFGTTKDNTTTTNQLVLHFGKTSYDWSKSTNSIQITKYHQKWKDGIMLYSKHITTTTKIIKED